MEGSGEGTERCTVFLMDIVAPVYVRAFVVNDGTFTRMFRATRLRRPYWRDCGRCPCNGRLALPAIAEGNGSSLTGFQKRTLGQSCGLMLSRLNPQDSVRSKREVWSPKPFGGAHK
ncbi:unnamed protein product [Pleuronectes platessa]|uniref:Uncharacterized protein n=1 Tax=Pleuronectes platessa TaxID=8262 RepID=A0A9N7VPB5_PLEPL|nr:unnamed protein product [Pleuronectes platessa]